MEDTAAPTKQTLRIQKAFARAFVLLLFAMVAFAALEVAARTYLVRFAPREKFLRYASSDQMRVRIEQEGGLFAPHPYLGMYPTPGLVKGPNRHNSLGFRGEEVSAPKPPLEFRIVCLGGSTTYTSSVEDHRLSYPSLLEQELRARGFANVRVVNAGCPDYGTHETLINFEMRVLDIDPDMVVFYEGINDVPSRLVWPPSAYRGDNGGYRGGHFGPARTPGILEHSTLLRMVMIRLGWTHSHAQLSEVRPTADTYRGYEFDRQTMNGTYPSGFFTEVPVERLLDSNPPRYYRRNLEVLIELARARKIGVLLATFAHFPVDSPPRRTAFNGPVFFRGIDEHNAALRGLAADTGTPLFDFAKAFPKERRLFNVEVFDGVEYTDAVHVSAEGSRLQARLFAEFLAQSGTLPR